MENNGLTDLKTQLSQVDLALKDDPNNDELLKVKADLEELLELYEDESEEVRADDTLKTKVETVVEPVVWKLGQTVLAQYTDKRFHEAVISALPTIESGNVYTVLYTKWGQSEKVKYEDIKVFNADEVPDYTKKKAHKRKIASADGKHDGIPKKSKKALEEERLEEKTKSWKSFATSKGVGKKR